MMKMISFVFLLLAYSCLRAQTISITLSNKFSLRDHGLTQKEGATFRAGDFYYCTETAYKNMQLAYIATLDKVKYGINVFKFDSGMKELKQVSLDVGSKSFGPFAPQAVFFNGKILEFYYHFNEKGAIQLLFSVVDPQTLDIAPAKELYVISERNVGAFKLGKAIEGNKLGLAVSPDSSRLLVSQSGNTNQIFTCIINRNLDVVQPVLSMIKGNLENFGIEQTVIDNGGNKYLTYSYTEDKLNKHGLLVQNNSGKEGYLNFKTMQDGLESGTLFLKVSKDNSKVYVFGATVGEFLEEGVFLATVEPALLRLGKPELFSYPQEVREQLYGMDYADKHHGSYSVKRADFLCNELEGGSVVLTGYPINTVTRQERDLMKPNDLIGHTVTDRYAGPIINIFIKEGKCNFGVIYRNQEMTSASGEIVIPYQDKLVCIYNDSEKSIASDNRKINGKRYDSGDLVLAEAVLASDGSLISKKKIAGRDKKLSYFTEYQQRISSNTYLIPIAQDKANLIRYYTEIEQWATLEIN
jgi:hypothetical protein